MTRLIDGPILVLHAPGDPHGGRDWSPALESAGWSGPVLAPDLPGHGDTPPPVGGNYELADAAFAALTLLVDSRRHDTAPVQVPPVVVGVGAHGWAAQLLALGGRAAGLVLVDGLGAPWFDVAEGVRLDRTIMRAVADDPRALAPHPVGGTDPRLVHGPIPHGSRRLARHAAAATPTPTFLVESDGSATTATEAAELAALFPAGAELHRVPDGSPSAVAAAVLTWSRSRRSPV